MPVCPANKGSQLLFSGTNIVSWISSDRIGPSVLWPCTSSTWCCAADYVVDFETFNTTECCASDFNLNRNIGTVIRQLTPNAAVPSSESKSRYSKTGSIVGLATLFALFVASLVIIFISSRKLRQERRKVLGRGGFLYPYSQAAFRMTN
jgi:hypothetical protein